MLCSLDQAGEVVPHDNMSVGESSVHCTHPSKYGTIGLAELGNVGMWSPGKNGQKLVLARDDMAQK